MLWLVEEAIAIANEISPDGLITIIDDRRNFDWTKNYRKDLFEALIII